MDKLTEYRQIIMKLLSEFAATANRSSVPNAECVTVFDTTTDQYMVVGVGWVGRHRMRGAPLHLRIHNGKIWVEDDMTDQAIALQLVAAGVPREDIVLGFQHPDMRPLTDFAVA